MDYKKYIQLNFIIAGIILAIFLYAGVYSGDNNLHPVKCIHKEILGSKCATCGMSQAFSAVLRLQVEKARAFQPNSISIFLFFLIQLFIRILIITIRRKNGLLKVIMIADLPLSLLMFIFFFRNLIFQTFSVFYKMIIA